MRRAALLVLLGALPLGGGEPAASAPRAGGLLVFAAAVRAEPPAIYIVREDGTGLRRVARPGFGVRDLRPAWSRDGRSLAFDSRAGTRVVGRGARIRRLGVGRPAWSPDGRRLAQVENSLLWVERTGGADPVGIAVGNPRSPEWSPDGRWIAFYAADGDGEWLGVARPDGSAVRLIAAADFAATGTAPSWSPDGQQVAYVSRTDIRVVDVRSGRIRNLTRSPGRVETDPVWSPDGRWIAFNSRSGDDDHAGELHLVPATGGRSRRLTRNRAPETSPSWSPDSSSLAFAGGESGIYVVRARDGNVRRLAAPRCPGEQIVGVTWGRGGRIAFARETESVADLYDVDWNLYTAPADDAAAARPLAATCALEDEPAWSRDGRRVAYTHNGQIYVSGVDGSGRRRVTFGRSPAWSRDGRQLVVVRGAYEEPRLVVVDVATGDARRLRTGGHAADPAWSPTADVIAFTGRDGIYTIVADAGDLRRLTGPERTQPAWSPDGTRLAYVHWWTLHTIRPDGSDDRLVYDNGDVDLWDPSWSPDGAELVVGWAEQDPRFWRLVLVAADGSGDRFLPRPRGLVYGPLSADWRPVPRG